MDKGWLKALVQGWPQSLMPLSMAAGTSGKAVIPHRMAGSSFPGTEQVSVSHPCCFLPAARTSAALFQWGSPTPRPVNSAHGQLLALSALPGAEATRCLITQPSRRSHRHGDLGRESYQVPMSPSPPRPLDMTTEVQREKVVRPAVQLTVADEIGGGCYG